MMKRVESAVLDNSLGSGHSSVPDDSDCEEELQSGCGIGGDDIEYHP
jgi:hypothetical protein